MDRVIIFDTTLRDGEQSPGFSMNTMEKLEMARQLARLRVEERLRIQRRAGGRGDSGEKCKGEDNGGDNLHDETPGHAFLERPRDFPRARLRPLPCRIKRDLRSRIECLASQRKHVAVMLVLKHA